MEMAKVTSKGQITIPVSIRRRLEIREGDKILFIESQIAVENVKSSGCFILVPNLHSFYRILRA